MHPVIIIFLLWNSFFDKLLSDPMNVRRVDKCLQVLGGHLLQSAQNQKVSDPMNARRVDKCLQVLRGHLLQIVQNQKVTVLYQ